jgi:hypothetical protein
MEALVIVNKRYAAILIAFLFLFGNAYGGEQKNLTHRITGTYSNFVFNKEAGDLNGVEVRLIFTRTGIKGVIQFAEGGAGDVVLVNVEVADAHVHFELPVGSQTEGVFDGTVSAKNLEGTFRYKNGARDHLILLRIQSYWDRDK